MVFTLGTPQFICQGYSTLENPSSLIGNKNIMNEILLHAICQILNNPRSLSKRLRYAPHTSQTCSFWWPEGPEVSESVFNSRSQVSFWCLALRIRKSSFIASETEPISPSTDTSRRPELMVFACSDICFNCRKAV